MRMHEEIVKALMARPGVKAEVERLEKADIEQGQADKRAGRVAPLDIEAIKAEGRKLRAGSAGVSPIDQMKTQALRSSASARNLPADDVRKAFGFMPSDIKEVVIRWPSL